MDAAITASPPDLQTLVEAHHFYCDITADIWRQYDEALATCKRQLRAKHVAIVKFTDEQGSLFTSTDTGE